MQPIQQVRARPERAFLLIQCDNDRTVAPHHGPEMKAASANPATELWVVHGCVRTFVTHPAEWEARVVAFLERELGR